MGAPRLTVQVLGPLAARVDGETLNLGGRRQRAVLAVLLLARGHLVTVDAIVDAVWGDDLPANAPAALQAYVSHLRRALEPDRRARDRASIIVSEGSAYALRLDNDAVDAWNFERKLDAAGYARAAEQARLLTEALALWRGPALLEYADQDFARSEAERWTELRTVAREQLLAARLDLGEAPLVIPEIEALLRDEPLREERWRLLVLALYRAHRQADALAALRRARSTLADELGVDPGPALRALEAEVLAQSDRLDPPSPPDPPQPSTSMTDTTKSGATKTATKPAQIGARIPAAGPETVIVDRDRELAVLRSRLTDALGGGGGVAVIEGPAGIGKSRLLAEVAREAKDAGATVLRARGSQLEREYGLGVVRQLFEPVIGDEIARERWLSGAAAGASGVFDAGSHEHRSDGFFGVLHGLYWLAVNVSAAAPLVVAVDDLQWCDTGSLRFLGYLTRRLEGLPILLVTTLRTGEPHDVEDLLTEITDDPLTISVAPVPL
ncbi:MAG TPA: BTAD domain-containing putative transcriptional regulator, partial [Nocardioidaceae bacterium]